MENLDVYSEVVTAGEVIMYSPPVTDVEAAVITEGEVRCVLGGGD